MLKIDKKHYKYIGIGVVALILMGMVFHSMTAARERKEREEVLANSEVISGGGDNSGGGGGTFNPKPYTDRLLSDFKAYTADTQLYDELIKLDDNKIRAIWSDWDSRLKNMEGNPQKTKTLALALYDAYWPTRAFSFGWDWTYHAKKFYDKMKTIGLH